MRGILSRGRHAVDGVHMCRQVLIVSYAFFMTMRGNGLAGTGSRMTRGRQSIPTGAGSAGSPAARKHVRGIAQQGLPVR